MKKKIEFRDEHGNIREPAEAVFPLLAHDRERLHVVGTGFFVAKCGIFLTAAHVSRHFSAETHDLMVPLLPTAQKHPPVLRIVLDVLEHKLTDVALGILQSEFLETGELIGNNTIVLTSQLPDVGEPVHCYSFPQTVVSRDGDTDVVIPLPRAAGGTVLAAYPHGRDSVMQPGICIETDLHVPNGGSGGPVFNSQGQAFGVVSTGIDDASVTYVAPFTELLDVPFARAEKGPDGKPLVLTLRSLAVIDKIRPQANEHDA